jgi:hypothetical protein
MFGLNSPENGLLHCVSVKKALYKKVGTHLYSSFPNPFGLISFISENITFSCLVTRMQDKIHTKRANNFLKNVAEYKHLGKEEKIKITFTKILRAD